MPPDKTGAALGPGEDDVARGVRRASQIVSMRGNPGGIHDSEGTLLWRYAMVGWQMRVITLGSGFRGDFVVTSPAGGEALRIRRVWGWRRRFEMIRDGQTVGCIAYRSLLRTSSTIELAGGAKWVFRQPLFSVHFYGDADTGQKLWVIVGPAKWRWNFLLPPGGDDIRLLAALALLHREYWTH